MEISQKSVKKGQKVPSWVSVKQLDILIHILPPPFFIGQKETEMRGGEKDTYRPTFPPQVGGPRLKLIVEYMLNWCIPTQLPGILILFPRFIFLFFTRAVLSSD